MIAADSTELPQPQQAPIPDGWTCKAEWYGHRFECVFHEAANPDRKYVVALLLFAATAELRQDGPRLLASRRDSTENVPPWVYAHAHTQIGALLSAIEGAPQDASEGVQA